MSKYPLNGSHYTEADDLEMLTHTEDWPFQLFVKRGHPATEFGIVEAVGPHGRIVHPSVAGTNTETVTYESPAAMVADGWRVD